jgi:pimeloyl-ACP methyl ester carboxylesterase
MTNSNDGARQSRGDAISPFRIDIPQADLDDLRDRLTRTVFAEPAPASAGPAPDVPPGMQRPPGWEHGVSNEYVRRLVEYWRTGYDWRAWEARLNAYPQFTTTIDGQRVHFIHVRSAEPDAIPLVLTHGWPGSIVEYLNIIDWLTDPRGHGAEAGPAFDVVIPSIPGYGFSGPTTEPGWHNQRIAAAWAELMRRLGYDRYGAVGNDAGSMISPEVGRVDPDHVIGVHVTQVFSFPSGDPAEMADLSEEEQSGMAVLGWFWQNLGAFNLLQSQQPQTLAHALADSPAGLLGWNGQLLGPEFGDDFILTNASIYWFTRTSGSAIRLYYENARNTPPTEPTTVPLGLAMGGGDFISIRRFADRDHSNIVSWNRYPSGGHYAAHLEPEQLSGDIRQFFAELVK